MEQKYHMTSVEYRYDMQKGIQEAKKTKGVKKTKRVKKPRGSGLHS